MRNSGIELSNSEYMKESKYMYYTIRSFLMSQFLGRLNYYNNWVKNGQHIWVQKPKTKYVLLLIILFGKMIDKIELTWYSLRITPVSQKLYNQEVD